MRSDMQPDDRVRLLHMVEAAETAAAFVAGRARADLDTDRMLLFAVVRAIEVVGEAAGKAEMRLLFGDLAVVRT